MTLRPPRRLRKLTVSTASGSDADVIDHDVIDIDDAREAVGDNLTFDIDDARERCTSNNNPTGQHEYTATDNFERCKHCGEASGI